MDRGIRYSDLIKQGLKVRRDYHNGGGRTDIEAVSAFDDEAGQYLLIWVGWQNKRRVENVMLHIRLRDGKIWIETDGTEDGFATELLKAGVPNSDIVLAFHPPHLRQYTDFAVA